MRPMLIALVLLSGVVVVPVDAIIYGHRFASGGREVVKRRHSGRTRRAFSRNEVLPQNFDVQTRQDIPTSYRLHDDLLRYYRKGTRPVTHPNKTVAVSISVFLYQIIKLDAVKNTISLAGSFELYWQDEFLQWNPKDYEGAKEIFLSSTDIWVPEISLYYSHHFNEEVVLSSNNDVRLNYTGNLRYYIPFSTESLCKLDVKFFPFDIQSCRLLFGSWAHSNESLAFRLYEKNLSLIDFYDNQEWQLDVTASKVKEESWLYDYLDPPLFWDMIIVDLVVSRQSFYYVFNLVIPSTIITLVAVIGFHMPSTSGRVRDAKFRLGIMTLMSMSVILLAIVEDMPKFSMHGSTQRRGSFSGIPLIGLYYFILLAITGLSTVTTSMFVFLERDVRVSHEIPWYLRWLAFDLTSHITRTFSYHRASRHDEITQIVKALSKTDTLSSADEDNQGSTPRQNLRKRLSLAHYDNMIMYQYFNQVLEDLLTSIIKIEQSLYGIRHELLSLLPRDDLNFKWNKVINRLEYLSLFFYCSLIFMTVMLFFFHGWYCSIGHSACNELNLKCPWMTVHPNDPSCQAA